MVSDFYTGVRNFQECSNLTKVEGIEDIASTMNILEILEKQYQCAGICSRAKYFAFSDILR